MQRDFIEMNNENQMIDRIYNETYNLSRISPIFISKKYGLNDEIAQKICQRIWLRNHNEARELAKAFQ